MNGYYRTAIDIPSFVLASEEKPRIKQVGGSRSQRTIGRRDSINRERTEPRASIILIGWLLLWGRRCRMAAHTGEEYLWENKGGEEAGDQWGVKEVGQVPDPRPRWPMPATAPMPGGLTSCKIYRSRREGFSGKTRSLLQPKDNGGLRIALIVDRTQVGGEKEGASDKMRDV